jgi:hypothetical protein
MVDKVQTTFKESTGTKHSIKVVKHTNVHMCMHIHPQIHTHALTLPFQMHIKKDKYLSRVEIKGYKNTVTGPNEDITAKTQKLLQSQLLTCTLNS